MDPQQPQQPSVNPQYTPASNTPEQPQQQFSPASTGKKTGLMVAAVAAVVIILGIVAFMLLGSDKKDDSSNNSSGNNSSSSSTPEESTPANDKLQKYDVTDSTTGLSFSVSFFKGAKSEEKNGRTYLTSGETGSLASVYLGAASGDKIDCGNSPTTTMKITGESTTVCYRDDNTQYAGYAKTKSGMVKVNVASQKALSIDDAKDILGSVTFK